MQTRVAEMLGVEFPILAFSHCRDVVAAVTTRAASVCSARWRTARGHSRSTSPGSTTQVKGAPTASISSCPIEHNAATTTAPRSTPRRSSQPLPRSSRQFVEEILQPLRGARAARRSRAGVGTSTFRGSRRGLARRPVRPPDPALRERARRPPLDLVERAHDAGMLVAALAGTGRARETKQCEGRRPHRRAGHRGRGSHRHHLHDGPHTRGRRHGRRRPSSQQADRSREPDRGRARARCRRRVVRIVVVDDGRSRNRPRRTAEPLAASSSDTVRSRR